MASQPPQPDSPTEMPVDPDIPSPVDPDIDQPRDLVRQTSENPDRGMALT